MTDLITPRYHLRSHGPLTPTISSSPTSPLPSPVPVIHDRSQAPTPRPCTTGRCTTPRRLRSLRPRPTTSHKRRFSEIQHTSDDNDLDDQDIDLELHLNVAKPIKNTKRRRRSTRRSKHALTVRFTLHTHHVTSLPAAVSTSSPIVLNSHLRAFRSLEFFAQRSCGSGSSRNPFICRYALPCGFEMGIASTLGAAADLKVALKILSQDLAPARCKASVQSKKNTFLLSVKRAQAVVAAGILQVDHVWKRVNIEMFGVDTRWRGNGLGSMMVYLVQLQMAQYAKYDLFVCAADTAVPFWSNRKYCFCLAHPQILEQHEIADEKSGGVRHLIWYGDAAKAGANLLRCFLLMQ